ncbi:uncharacterized protein LOC117293249 isoform X2 [Asterias rubens]|uniref:uncharacterized protein LOC117293249 isoform X2 n=1 Tax=Asterias rubens TaxID=7604 RepID=UPI001455A683|nr:uncharacterized protein LOC117293249 isoform X2 [Asterias rubens]
MSSTLANSSMYLKQVFFFDIHPPLGKLLLAGAGYMADTNVTFPFERIGDDNQSPNHVQLGTKSVTKGKLRTAQYQVVTAKRTNESTHTYGTSTSWICVQSMGQISWSTSAATAVQLLCSSALVEHISAMLARMTFKGSPAFQSQIFLTARLVIFPPNCR